MLGRFRFTRTRFTTGTFVCESFDCDVHDQLPDDDALIAFSIGIRPFAQHILIGIVTDGERVWLEVTELSISIGTQVLLIVEIELHVRINSNENRSDVRLEDTA